MQTPSRHEVQQSDALDHGVQVGLVAYGVVHLLVAYTALRLALGDRGKADQQGALSQLAQSPGGDIGLWVVAGGFFALVVWQAFEAGFGHLSEDGAKRWAKRGASVVKAVVYLILGVSAVQKAAGSPSSGSSGGTDSMTARLMSAPGGQVIVGLVGLSVIAAGGYLVHKGWTERFTKRLDVAASSGDRRTAVVSLGKVGYVAKGLALGIIGALFTAAAVQFEPKESGGLDQALKTLLDQPFGPVLVLVMAAGIASYGVYCFAWARHLDR